MKKNIKRIEREKSERNGNDILLCVFPGCEKAQIKNGEFCKKHTNPKLISFVHYKER
jgi:hypothetical protein